MNIGRDNYEKYMIDYIDGKLNSMDSESMRKFLVSNPDIADELAEIKDYDIKEYEKSDYNKTVLYKNYSSVEEVTEKNFEEFCIAFHENDLDELSKSRLTEFIGKDKEKSATFKLFQTLKITPDFNIRFQNKRLLKKYNVPVYRKYLYYSASIAAAITLIIIFRVYVIQKETNYLVSENKSSNFFEAKTSDTEKSLKELKIQPEENTQKEATEKLIVAVDTGNNEVNNRHRLASISPIEAKMPLNNQIEPSLASQFMILSQKNEIINTIEENKNIPQDLTKQKNRKGDKLLLKVLKIGVKGIGNLTESNIEFATQTDANGKLTSYAITAGEFEILRKMNSKSQKN